MILGSNVCVVFFCVFNCVLMQNKCYFMEKFVNHIVILCELKRKNPRYDELS